MENSRPSAWHARRQAHEKTGRDEDGDDRDEDVAERAGHFLDRRHLRVGFLFVADAGERRAFDEFVKDLVDKARAEDDLILSRREELALDAVDVLDGLLVDLRLVVDDEAQARRAMLRVADVVLAADVFPDELRDALLVREVVVLVVVRGRGFRRSRRIGGRFRDDRLVAERDRDVAVVRRVRHDERRRRLVARRLDRLGVELEEQLAFLDLVALRGLGREVLAVQLDRVHADVDEHLDAVFGLHADGVLRLEEHRDLAVERCEDLPFRVLDRRAAAHRARAEDRIVHRAECDELALDRAVQTNVFHFSYLLFSLKPYLYESLCGISSMTL